MPCENPWPTPIDRLGPSVDGSRRIERGRRIDAARVARSARAQPLVTYLTVVRNGAATVERALRSVRDQTWPHVEHIVIDGLSGDGTLDVLLEHVGQIDYLVSEADAGLYAALNKAVPLARGDLICVLNADDWLTRDAAALAAGAYLAAGADESRLILSAAWVEGGSRRRLWSPARLDLGGYLTCANICHNGVYATPGAYRASGPYATDLRIASDFRWLMRCVDAGVEVSSLDVPTVHYVLGGLSSDTRRHVEECARILGERFPFLSDAEVWGLLHAFHVFRDHLQPFAAARPPQLGRFLRDLARAHAGDPDFARALALASTALLRHPDDGVGPDRLSRADKARRSLRRRWMAARNLLLR
ncbi:MAG: glycosyltransferase [Burkholderiales bacterium]|nr:glycosyltransferase [Burkholderiales bacterium]